MEDNFYFNDTADYKDHCQADQPCCYCESMQGQFYEQLCDSYDTSEGYWSAALRESDNWEVLDLRPFFQESQSMYRKELKIDIWEDWEPIRKERIVDIWERQLETMTFRLRMEFDGRVGLRRMREKALNEVLPSYFEGEIDPRLTPHSMSFNVISQASDQCFDRFLSYIFSCEDLQFTGSSSLRHKAIGVLLDGYAVYSRLVTDVAAVMAGKLSAISREKDWKLKFLQAIHSRQELKELCERDWSSCSGRAMQQCYSSLQP